MSHLDSKKITSDAQENLNHAIDRVIHEVLQRAPRYIPPRDKRHYKGDAPGSCPCETNG